MESKINGDEETSTMESDVSDTASSMASSQHTSFFSLPFSVQWRKALVSLPRLAPLQAVRWLGGDTLDPSIVPLPSRSKHLIPIYVFVPENAVTKSTGLPVCIDAHGGGHVVGSCLEQATFCTRLCRALSAVVITVDYRMGPIDKFPAAIEDCEDVLRAVLDESAPGYNELRKAIKKKLKVEKDFSTPGSSRSNLEKLEDSPLLDTSRIALSGFSSGGNLALNLALSIAADPPGVISDWPSVIPNSYATRIPLLLYYPSFDCRQLPSERPRPPGLNASKGGFWSGVNDMLMPTYLPRDIAGHPRASPGLADLRNGGLHPKARVQLVLPELDSLSEQSEAWVKKMHEQGRGDDLRVDRYKGMKHGWTQIPEKFLGEDEIIARNDAVTKTVEFVKAAWYDREETSKIA